MRKFLTSILGMMLFVVQTFAQSIEVNGRVTDASGAPIPGATIKIKGSRTGTSAGQDGTFKLSVPSKATLQISAVGYETIEAAASSSLNITLKQAKSELTEVVVTAVGIKREKKALGYAVTSVDKKDLELRPEGDLARVLNGKAPGLNILSTTGLTGSGTNISIRGISTITGNSSPLIIVDGVPFDNSTNSQSNFTFGIGTSSRLLDIDPNNIENVSILKGLSATTIYGEAGRNGVILITTKNGATDKRRDKPEITVSQSYSATKAILPEYNDKYGGGFDLSVGIAFFSNWGGAFQNPPVNVTHPYDKAKYAADFPQFTGAPYAYKFYNSVPNFFRTGSAKNTAINVAGTASKLNYNVNYSYTDDQGYLIGNRMYKNNLGMGGTLKFSDKLKVSATINYVNTDVASPPTSDSYGNNPSNASVFGNVMYTPTAVDLMGLPYEFPSSHGSIYYRNSNDIQNPRWTLFNSFTQDKVSRVYGQMSVVYELIKGLNLTYKIGYDNYTENQLYAQNKGGIFTPLGIMRTSNGTNTIWDNNFIAQYTKRFNDISLDLTGGVSSRTYQYEQTGQTSSQQLVYGILNHQNFVDHTAYSEDGSSLNFIQKSLLQGAYGFATVGYKDFVYATVGGRQDWSSKLEPANRSVFYPNGSLSFIPTSILNLLKDSKSINFLKLRVGYSTSANYPAGFYDTRSSLNVATKQFVTAGGASINTNSIPNKLPNPNLKPESPREIEAGLEGKFINSRLSVDLTFYKRTAKNQILTRSLDPATGYTFEEFNAGTVENKGIELGMGYTVIRNKDWSWQLDMNYTLNRSNVSDIPSDIQQVGISGYSNFGTFAKNGYPINIIMGNYFERDAKTGQKLVGTDGNYINSSVIGVIGDPTPLYRINGSSTLRYRFVSLRFQLDFTKGGKMFSSTADALLGRGVTADTKFDRALPMILPGVDANGNPNTIQISATQAYFTNNLPGGGSYESGIYDATVFRVREVSLAFEVPNKLLTKTPFTSLSFVVNGNNLWYNAPNFPKYTHFDPEASGTGVGNGRGLELLSGPSARRFGASIKVTF
ncbi:MAG: SusC/RagA family TonB-linked outer membrane protein [Sphingobacteriales bacterium]|nr:MAG: SusC/RagA family TonB-linked outer membrane protein [Sphingobacteriales bacterium]